MTSRPVLVATMAARKLPGSKGVRLRFLTALGLQEKHSAKSWQELRQRRRALEGLSSHAWCCHLRVTRNLRRRPKVRLVGMFSFSVLPRCRSTPTCELRDPPPPKSTCPCALCDLKCEAKSPGHKLIRRFSVGDKHMTKA